MEAMGIAVLSRAPGAFEFRDPFSPSSQNIKKYLACSLAWRGTLEEVDSRLPHQPKARPGSRQGPRTPQAESGQAGRKRKAHKQPTAESGRPHKQPTGN